MRPGAHLQKALATVTAAVHKKKGQGYRNGYPFPEGENIVLRQTDPFLENRNCAWSNGYLFAKAANRPRGNGYVPGSQHGPRNRHATYTDRRFPKSLTQLGEP